jgi:hypothetical protein
MTAVGDLSTRGRTREPGFLARWWRRRGAVRRQIDHAVWDLRERYGEAAYLIARSSARQPVGTQRREFWRKVAAELERAE